jgi:acyl-CoA synthetase (AMP-forming)/AMP-acid ligase II
MGELTRTNLVWKALDVAARTLPDRRGYVYQGEEISFKDMDERSDRVAAGFLKMGIDKGDRIGIIALNQPEWLYTYFAAAKIGAVVVGLNVRYRESELDYMLNQSQAKAVVTLPQLGDMDYVSFFKGFREKIPTVQHFFFIGSEGFPGSLPFAPLLQTAVDEKSLASAKAAVAPEDLMIIIYTSGTTGKPKGAAITHQSQMASATAQAEHTRAGEDDLILLPLPFNHVGGITCGVLTLLAGKGTCVLIPVFIPDVVIEAAITYQPTLFAGVPTIHVLCMMSEKFATWVTRDRVRMLISGGSNAEPDLLKKLTAAYPRATVMNLYGLSESSGAAVMSTWDSDFETTVRSIGQPIGPFQVKIIDLRGNELPKEETGELLLKGDCVAAGYFRMPEETAAAFDQDGWLHTGDMARINERGYITLVGRKKEMYIQGGFNVYPVEVENLLVQHPKVMFAAGIGVPDPVLGEVGRYYIVPKPGVSDISEEEIKSFCRESLADYKVPKQVVFRPELPLTPLGKVMKSALKETYEKTGK